jgi:hypothetical protein
MFATFEMRDRESRRKQRLVVEIFVVWVVLFGLAASGFQYGRLAAISGLLVIAVWGIEARVGRR